MSEIPAATEELLRHLEEEAAEIVHAVLKLRRFGPEGKDPRMPDGPNDREAVGYEYGQLLAVQECLDALDPELLTDEAVQWGRRDKLAKLRRYLKHSTLQVSDEGVTVCPK